MKGRTLSMALIVAIAVPAGAQAPRWRYREIPNPFPSNIMANAMDINNAGQIAINLSLDGRGENAAGTAIRQPNGAIRVAPRAANNIPWGGDCITESGMIGGRRTGASIFPIRWQPISGQLWQFGPTPESLGPIQFNSSGFGVARMSTSFGMNELIAISPTGNMWDLAAGYPTYGDVNAINDAGYIAGYLTRGNFERQDPILWNPGGLSGIELHSPNQLFGGAYAISVSGEVFGIVSKNNSRPGWYGVWWDTQGNALRESFLYEPDPVQGLNFDLFNAGGFSVRSNSNGAITFFGSNSTTGVNSVKYFSPLTGIVDITESTVGLPSGFTISQIRGINDSDVMVGVMTAALPNGSFVSRSNFYLEPVPEPTTLAALGVGGVVLMRRRKERRH